MEKQQDDQVKEGAGDEEVGTELEMSDSEAESRRAQFKHRRKPSWITESHPRFVWGDDETRKQIVEEVRRERQRSTDLEGDERRSVVSGEEEEEDDEVDDDDMKYGLDPGFSDIDEELRVIEGMISEHTVIREVEVDDDEVELSHPVDLALSRLRIHGSRKLSFEEEASQASKDGETIQPEEPALPPSASTSSTTPDTSLASDTTPASGEPPNLIAEPPTPPNEKTTVQEDAATMSAAEKQKAEHKKRVRLVELPDYLAMVAREHRRQLLEKQKRDLLLAAQAANARDAASSKGQNVGPRSQNSIRRGYFDRLGIAGDSAPVSPTSSVNASRRLDMGINARRAAIASARTRRRAPSLRVKLREAPPSSKGQGFFKKLASWMSADTHESSGSAGGEVVSSAPGGSGERFSLFVDNHGSSAKSTPSSSPAASRLKKQTSKKRSVAFIDVADVYFIPARSDYPSKIKHAIWHTRAEFVDMVMTNMEQVELEMQQEAEARRRLQDLRDNPPPTGKASSAAPIASNTNQTL